MSNWFVYYVTNWAFSLLQVDLFFCRLQFQNLPSFVVKHSLFCWSASHRLHEQAPMWLKSSLLRDSVPLRKPTVSSRMVAVAHWAQMTVNEVPKHLLDLRASKNCINDRGTQWAWEWGKIACFSRNTQRWVCIPEYPKDKDNILFHLKLSRNQNAR